MFVFTFSLYVKLSIKSGSIEVIYLELHKPKNTADKDSRYENFALYQSEPLYEGKLKVILLLQVSSHDFEPTFIIFCLN